MLALTLLRMRCMLPLALAAGLNGCAGEGGGAWPGAAGDAVFANGSGSGGLGQSEIAAGLKEALRVGTDRVVATLGRQDGFYADPAVRIPLPRTLSQAQSSLRLIGASGLIDDLELRINRAAEQATPVAKDIFWQAITGLTFDDVNGILHGADDAATRYLDRSTRGSLTEAMRPIIDRSLADAGAVAAYDRVIERAQLVAFLPDLKTNLADHVLSRTMDGIFSYLATEEAAIRQDPLKRSTALLKRVFGGPT